MNKTLEKAIIKTYQKHGLRQARGAIIEAINNGNINGFTNDENARIELDIKNPSDFKIEIFGKYLESVLNSDKPKDNLESAIQKTYKKFEDRTGDGLEVVERCLNDLFDGNNHFTRDGGERALLDELIRRLGPNITVQDWMLDLISQKVVETVVNEKLLKQSMTLQNVEVYSENIKELQASMISGLTHDKEGSIQIANMQAATKIGNVRANQEDAVLLMTHPENPDFKMMVVSDGMGGHNSGEEASHITIDEIKNWFSKLSPEYYKNVGNLQNVLDDELNEISNKIFDKFGGNGGATFVGAIVGEEETLLSNVGDSRGYMLKGRELIPITRDQAVVQNLFESGEIEERDDMRFHKSSNIITQFIGAESVDPQFYIANNKDYDMLFLFSDGVTDCLSDNNLLAITKTTSRKYLASRILDNALRNESKVRDEIAKDANYNSVIPPGKDNATAAILFNDREENERE